jgi:hypothetical protein
VVITLGDEDDADRDEDDAVTPTSVRHTTRPARSADDAPKPRSRSFGSSQGRPAVPSPAGPSPSPSATPPPSSPRGSASAQNLRVSVCVRKRCVSGAGSCSACVSGAGSCGACGVSE